MLNTKSISGAPAGVTSLFESAGISLPDSINVNDLIAMALSEFEEATGYWPFIAGSESTERDFAHPDSNILDLGSGLVSLDSLTINGQAYTLNQQFTLKPQNAASNGKPYTYIDFGRHHYGGGYPGLYDGGYSAWGGSNSQPIAVTGVWGFCLPSAVPAQVIQALIRKAAAIIGPEASLAISGGLALKKVDNVETRYSAGSDSGPLSAQIAMWNAVFDRTAMQYRRVSF